MLLVAASAQAAEFVCFRTAAEAVVQAGVRDREGYRLEAVRRDTFEDVNWATVRSCGHPEQPAQLVLASRVASRVASREIALPARASSVSTPVWSAAMLRAGSQVTLVITDGVARIEMQAIAMANAVVGNKVKVRLLSGSAGEERFAEGTVRDRTLVEVVQ
jgi:hypothetical protein